jgi:hypothetical protein
VDLWGVVTLLVPLAMVVLREYMALRREATRRDSIERILNTASSGVRITDRTADGGSIDIVVDQAAGQPGQPARQHDRLAR